jgi:uncharacterized membrane protein YphA (DoxX/SURF4 family)
MTPPAGAEEALSALLGALFVTSGVAKISDGNRVASFATQAGVPRALARLVPTGLPATEIVVGACLLSTRYSVAAAASSICLTTLFFAVAMSAWRRGVSAACRCFGVIDQGMSAGDTLLRAGVVLSLAALLLGLLTGSSPTQLSASTANWWLGIALATTLVMAFALRGAISSLRVRARLLVASQRACRHARTRGTAQ